MDIVVLGIFRLEFPKYLEHCQPLLLIFSVCSLGVKFYPSDNFFGWIWLYHISSLKRAIFIARVVQTFGFFCVPLFFSSTYHIIVLPQCNFTFVYDSLIDVCLLHWTLCSTRTLFCFLLYLQSLVECLAQNICSVNPCWMSERIWRVG